MSYPNTTGAYNGRLDSTLAAVLGLAEQKKTSSPCTDCKQHAAEIRKYTQAVNTANDRIKEAKQRIVDSKNETRMAQKELESTKSEMARLQLESEKYKKERDDAFAKMDSMMQSLAAFESKLHNFLTTGNYVATSQSVHAPVVVCEPVVLGVQNLVSEPVVIGQITSAGVIIEDLPE